MIALTTSQKVVSGLYRSENQLVIAGPGTGKTTTAIELIKSIDSQLNFNEDRSVLFLSFSRAAIQAAFDSMQSEIEGLDLFVEHQTLDSLASSQLAEFGQLDETNSNFDSRIRVATNLLKDHGDELLEDICHIIVDEAQDILGIRQDYLIEIVSHLPKDCGISIFGDPYQAIYQFLSQKNGHDRKSPEQQHSLIEWELFVERIFKDRNYTTNILKDQFRASGILSKKIFGELELVRESKSRTEATAKLRSTLSDLNALTMRELKAFQPRWTGSVSLLTRTNSDAIQLFEALTEQQLSATIILRKELGPTLPSWLGKWALESNENSFTSRELEGFIANNETYSEQAKKLGIEFAFDQEISWDEIRQNSRFYSPRSIVASTDGSILISTVHQSKGLEFDNILVHNPEQYVSDTTQSNSAIEVLFVALSRGKKRINSFHDSVGKVIQREKTLIRPHPNPKFLPKAICINPRDIRSDRKVGDRASQERLAAFSPGDKLHFEVISPSFEFPIYRCYLDNLPVATTTEDFGRRLVKITQPKGGKWPLLSPVSIVDLQSAFSKDASQKTPFLIPMPLGFSDIKFK